MAVVQHTTGEPSSVDSSLFQCSAVSSLTGWRMAMGAHARLRASRARPNTIKDNVWHINNVPL